jgi:hypothetical protein
MEASNASPLVGTVTITAISGDQVKVGYSIGGDWGAGSTALRTIVSTLKVVVDNVEEGLRKTLIDEAINASSQEAAGSPSTT